MKRLLLVCLIGGIVAVAYGFATRSPSQIALMDGKAFATSGMASMLMVGLTIQNKGAADVLLDVSSPAAEMVTLVNPNHNAAPLIVPADSDGILAMDGAHVMLRAREFHEGGFMPLTLTFKNAGEISTRIQHAGVGAMSHDAADGILVDPVPQADLRMLTVPDAGGVALRLEVADFRFHRGSEDATHLAGQGHAHLYLNGLKLARLYAPEFHIGALPVGRYDVTVVLNSNDHRAYVDEDGKAVGAAMELKITK